MSTEARVARASGLVLRRALTQKLVVLSAFGTILLATTILSTLILYATSVTDDGIKRTLTTAPIDEVGTRITSRIENVDAFGTLDAQVRATTDLAYAGAPTTIYSAARSESYGLPGQEDEPDPKLTVFATYEQIEEHARLTAGTWPGGSGTDGPVEVAVPTGAAQAAEIEAGSTVTVRSRLADDPVEVTVTGLFEAVDRNDPYWQVDDLALTGSQTLAFTTYGPLLVPRETFMARFAADSPVAWQVVPDLSDASSQQVHDFTDAFPIYRSELTANQPNSNTTVDTNLSTLATNLDRASLVARSTMLIPVLQLVVLAGYALFLTARLLADHRRAEISLLRARGADGGQLAALTLREGLMLGVPAAIAAPLLAVPLLRLVNASSTVGASGLTIDASLRTSSWIAATVAAGVCALALAAPSLRGAAKTYVESQQARGRGERRSAIQRAGADLAVLAVAALGFWQLQHYGGPLTATAEQARVGGIGIDPFIVAGPAIGLFAGGILALRLVPVMSGAAERVTSRGSGFAPALGAWQVARRPLRYAGPALLLVLAVAVGVLSLGTSSTWRKSQIDQANHQAGADLRIFAKSGAAELPMLGHGGRYQELPGVTAISPAARLEGIVGNNNPTELIAVDAEKLSALLSLRPDLEPSAGIDQLAGQLAASRPKVGGMPIPGEPVRLAIDARLGRPGAPTDRPHDARAGVIVHLRDAAGTSHATPAGEVEGDNEIHTLVVDLAARAGTEGRIAYPLSLEGFTFTYVGGIGETSRVMTIENVRGSDSPTGDLGEPAALPADNRWDSTATINVGGTLLAPAVDADSDATLRTSLPTSPNDLIFGAFGASYRAHLLLSTDRQASLFPPIGTRERPVLDAIVSSDVLGITDTQIGDQVTLVGTGSPQPVRIAGVVDSMPTVEGGHSGILVDFRAWSAAQFVTGGTHPVAREWWAATERHDSDPAAAAIAENPLLADDLVHREGLVRDLLDDPLGSGLQGALYLGFLAAFAFAAIGFAVNAAVSARERLTEFALMRAMGVSSRQVFGLLGVEQALLVALGVVGGVALGALVTQFVVPHIVLTAQATEVTPPVLISIPWLQVLVLVAGVLAVLALIVVVLAGSLRRGGLGAALRIGEDQ